jgi:hypothetical protein
MALNGANLQNDAGAAFEGLKFDEEGLLNSSARQDPQADAQHAANQGGFQAPVHRPANQNGPHDFNQAAFNQVPQAPAGQQAQAPDFDAYFTRLEERLTNRLKDQLSSTVEDALSTSLASKKRKADLLKNEGIKKQYIPIEEASLRMKAVRDSLSNSVEEGTPLDSEDAAKLRDHLDEGIKIIDKRMAHLEVAQHEGWDVAKKMEENALVLHLSEEMQQQLKKAKKEVKEENNNKKEKGSGKKSFKKGGKPFWRNNSSFGGTQGGGFQKGPKGPCFSCGQFGHISQWCPNKGVVAANAGRNVV